jgi:fatty-acyl-CoA synthase
VTNTSDTADLLWPTLTQPGDLTAVEQTPLQDRGLPESTYALLERAATMWPDREAVLVLPDAERWEQPSGRTYARLLADVESTAELLRNTGIGRTDVVALISPNCDELITATLAAETAGIAMPINSALAAEHIEELIRRAGATVLIAAGPELDDSTWRTACRVGGAAGMNALYALRPTGVAGDEAPALVPVDGVRTAYLSAETTEDAVFGGTAPTSSDLAAFFHTGGTTGDPKLAAHTHANQVANAWMIAAGSDLDEGATVFAALPLFHVNALLVTTLAPITRGQTVLWAGPLGYRDLTLYAQFWNIVERYRIAAMSAVPTVYSVLAQCPVNADISSLQSCIVGASALPPAVRESFETHTGVPLLQGYGLTEATCASARSFRDAPRNDAVGQRFPYQLIKAVHQSSDGTWTDLAPGQVGTITISGPTVFAGYVLERTSDGFVLDGLGKLIDGWLDTGDLGRVDAEGFVSLTGRAKDLIIRGGHNIDPAVIENALLAHPAVTGAAAVGRPDPHSGEVPVAYVTVTAADAVTVDELTVWAHDQVAEAAAVPKSVTIVDAIPVTDVGKPYKVALRADATRLAAVDALESALPSASVGTVIENGSVVVIVDTDDHRAVAAALGRYPIAWRTGTTS